MGGLVMDTPSTATEIKGAISAVIAFGTAIFGWVGWVVIIWLATMLLDYLTGTWAAMSHNEWSSAIARQGLWHKLGSIVAMLVAALCDIALSVIVGQFTLPFDYKCLITPVVALWYIFTELGSITENAAKLGANIPPFLLRIIAKAKDAAEDAGDDISGE